MLFGTPLVRRGSLASTADMKAAITDNWTLQDAVELLAGESDPSELTPLGDWSNRKKRSPEVPKGAIQLHALATALTLLVLVDRIDVLDDWIQVWRGKRKDLDALLGERVVGVPGREDPQVADLRSRYQTLLDEHPAVQGAPADAVTVGTAVYLARAQLTNAVYSPHPHRARFLSRTLWVEAPAPHLTRFLQLVDEARVRVSRAVFGDAVVNAAIMSVPSIPLYCLRHASSSVSPITVAVQLYDDPSMKDLRAHMEELRALLDEGKEAAYIRCVAAFTATVSSVEKTLGIRALDESDGPDRITIVGGLGIPVPDALRRVRTPERHSGLVTKLVLSGREDIRSVLSRSLGISDRSLLERILESSGKVIGAGRLLGEGDGGYHHQ